MKNSSDLGAAALAMVCSVDPKQYKGLARSYIVANSAGRFLEEAVELALALGLGADQILGRVGDALHNEANKAGVYPSGLLGRPFHQDDVLIELGDVHLMTAYLAELTAMPFDQVSAAAWDKLALLEKSAASGGMVMVDGCVYRKPRPQP